MFRRNSVRHRLGGVLLACLAMAPLAMAQSAESRFHKAYYLENQQEDFAAAEKLYAQVATDRQADQRLREQARGRQNACSEEVRSADFASLMPHDALAYVEVNRPGEQLKRLLGQLGMLREDGQLGFDPQTQFAISRDLITELLGLRGIAAAVTGFDPANEAPTGVAILHPGRIEVIRGLIETALPAGGIPTDPIEGYPTFHVENEVFVTLTARLVIISQQRHEIEDVILRLKGEGDPSLADNEQIAAVLANREDSLIYFCAHFKPMMPLINAAIAAAGTQSQEVAMAQAIFDINSLKTIVGRAGMSDAGLHLDLALELDAGHHNLAFNFMRMPPLNRETLQRIPAGAAGFVAASLNPVNPGYAMPQDASTPPIVTAWDIGREVFGNLTSFAVFALPHDSGPASASPIPSAAAVLTVNDPDKSMALWGQFLGVGSMGAAGGAIDGLRIQVDGAAARQFTYPDGVSVFLAGAGNDVLIATSKDALSSALAARRGKSIADDPAFEHALENVGPDATFAALVHPGRCLEIAKPFMSRSDLAEAQPFMDAMPDTVASFVLSHSPNRFRLSTLVSGLPNLGPVVAKLIAQEREREMLFSQLDRSLSRDNWDGAIEAVRKLQEAQPENVDLLWREFKILATGAQNRGAAVAVGQQLFEQIREDAFRLNNYAWAMLTDDAFGGQYTELALKFARLANELSDYANWYYVDTLAWAHYHAGEYEEAVRMEEKALELCTENSRRGELEEALDKFKAKLNKGAVRAEVADARTANL